MTTNILWSIVAAIRITEGVHSSHPYGIIPKYHNTTPQRACFNTVNHFYLAHPQLMLTRGSIKQLSDVYCPQSVDPVGNRNWNNNMVKLLHITTQ